MRNRPPGGAPDPIPVAVVGASGYTGAELCRLLLDHPGFELSAVFAGKSAGARLAEIFPQFSGRTDLEVRAFSADEAAEAARIGFCALPHGASAGAVAALRARGVIAVDLSADFRISDPEVYAAWYGGEGDRGHPHPELLAEAVYGVPELWRDEIRYAGLVATPGCYPTTAILATAPLLAAALVEPTGIVIDAKSGASGAGRSPGQATHLPEAGEGVRPYKVAGSHRHTPEIEQALSRVAGAPVTITFTPHLLPMSRGILACVYARPTDPDRLESAYREAMEAAYADEPFVTVLPAGRLPDTAHVRGSNRIHVAVELDRRAGVVIAIAALDNLVKGAAGQAIQCANIIHGFEETAGLEAIGLFP
jgi:N-acetyl-gamma-glutamyl-phosphate reductase